MPGCNACASIPDANGPAADGRFRRVLWVALVINAIMFVVEFAASWVGGSMALQADALDFLGDSLNYALSLAVIGASVRHRAGAALVKGSFMAGFGVWVLGASAYRAVNGLPPDAALMGMVGFAALVANVFVAATLYRYRSGDSNMRSVWLCSRNDAIANLAVIAAAGGVALTASRWPDLLVAVLVAGLCLSSAAQVARQALREIRHGARPAPQAAAAHSEYTSQRT